MIWMSWQSILSRGSTVESIRNEDVSSLPSLCLLLFTKLHSVFCSLSLLANNFARIVYSSSWSCASRCVVSSSSSSSRAGKSTSHKEMRLFFTITLYYNKASNTSINLVFGDTGDPSDTTKCTRFRAGGPKGPMSPHVKAKKTCKASYF